MPGCQRGKKGQAQDWYLFYYLFLCWSINAAASLKSCKRTRRQSNVPARAAGQDQNRRRNNRARRWVCSQTVPGYPVYSLVVSYLQNRPHNSHTSKQSYAQANRLKCKYVKNTSPAPAAECLLWSWTGHVFKQPLPKSLWEQCNPFSHPLCHPVFSGLTASRKVQT